MNYTWLTGGMYFGYSGSRGYVDMNKSAGLYSAGNDTSTQLRSLHERYVQKQITKDQYIKELNQKARMIVLENQ